MIRRVLIANRGEIARRVIRACRAMNIATVAVYSDADSGAPHVREADSAEPIGPAPASESYLNIERVIDAARRSGADAVHPGYGFLSENADFADACERAGLIFVGPPGGVIRRMGSKSGARAAVSGAGVPVVPGEAPSSQDPEALAKAVAKVGLPAVLKASAGGGGKGMRIVRPGTDVGEAIAAASSEALRAFGNGTLYVERLIEHARHIEVQVIADTHGALVHLLERDCTLQRRHQKVVEEAPAPRLDAGVRAKLHEAALAAARAVGYINAGTVEFLVEGDGTDARFYFLEMNTRLQVEHPITEAITGFDLVQLQLRVAAGERLPITQSQVVARGHAIEARVYAEDSRRLLPQSGRLLVYREPMGPGVRVDSGVVPGQTVTVHYDPLLAKLIVHADTREAAIAGLDAALSRFEILGLLHNIAFVRRLLARAEFREVRMHTRFIEESLAGLTAPPPDSIVRAAAAIAAFTVSHVVAVVCQRLTPKPQFRTLGIARPVGALTHMAKRLHLSINASGSLSAARWTARVQGADVLLDDSTGPLTVTDTDGRLHVSAASSPGVDASELTGVAASSGDVVWVTVDGEVFAFNVTEHADRQRSTTRDQEAFTPPMSATVVRINVAPGDTVRDGDVLIALEAMKMELPIRAPRDGRVRAVHCRPGELVQPDQVLIEFDD